MISEARSPFWNGLGVRQKKFARIVLGVSAFVLVSVTALASAPDPGGNTTVVKPSDESAVSVTEDSVQPESANIRLIVPTLNDPAGGTPSSIRILSVSGGTLWTSGGSSITLGANGTTLGLSSGKVDLRFRPDAGRDSDASFQYAVVDPHDGSVNSSASTAVVPITAVNDTPLLQTESGDTGLGLAATYYLDSWELTGSTYNRIDATINFGNNFSVTGMNNENFSVRWTGKVKSPITGDVTFSTVSDDGVRVWIDDELIINNWTLHGDTTDTASPVSLVENQLYNFRMEFYERGGGEVARLRWAYTGQSTQIVPQAYLFPATTRPTLSYVSGSPSAVIDDAITISDVDSTIIASGSVVISSNYTSDEDSLLFTNQNGISGSTSGNTLLLTGTASLANYQTALRSVRYANSESSPTTSTRTVQFKVSDSAGGESNFTFRNISFTNTNSAPVITEGATTSVTMDQDSSPTPFSLTLHATDADYHSISWSVSSAASHGTATVSGAGDSKEISYEPDSGYNGSDSFIVQASDGMGGTDTITVSVTITERNPPEISDISATASGSTAAIITWTTDEDASTQVEYGLTGLLGTSTSETDTSPRVTSHTRLLTGLHPCTRYHYSVTSADENSNTATESGGFFITGGCPGEATVISSTGTTVISNANGSTGSIVLSGSSVSLVVPSGYIASNSTCPTGAIFQLKAIESSPVRDELGSPSGRDVIVNAHALSAFCPDATPVTSFDEIITITVAYSDSDIENLVESSLGLYRYGSGSTAWQELTCSQNMSANTLTCDTTDFSSFGLFGTVPSPTTYEAIGSGGGGGGCRGNNCGKPSLVRSARSTHSAASAQSCSAETIPSRNGRLWLHEVEFTDVSVEEWYACAVNGVVSKGIFSGYKTASGAPSGKYGPGDHITLGQLAKVAVALAKQDTIGEQAGNDWASAYLREAQTMKLTIFTKRQQADKPATRGAVIQTILESLGIPLEDESDILPYSDVPAGSLYARAIATATKLGIVAGDDGKETFRPNAPVNRAEVAKMILLALEQARR